MTKVIFLGTGTSTGVPEVGCGCEVCTSENRKDKRLRTSILVIHEGKHILIDCGPDFRYQMLRSGNKRIDGVVITHEHYDHTAGLDDLRPFCKEHPVRVYAEPDVTQKLRTRMPYCFREVHLPGTPNLQLCDIDLVPFEVEGVTVTPVRLLHGKLPIMGFRIGDVAFLTDLSEIPESEYDKLKDVEVLIIVALRKKKHIAHQNLEEALAQIARIQPKRSFLIHSSHHLGLHDDIVKELPENVFLSYDGLEIEI
ncbi:MBL fold metallo-hydrolase [Parabacteroides sp. FAFU027]|uniref:MBL fold metallo-hydrolase n=1 Tax=Parabacteroides sp. FAFU027 TaxID=2922715 RepID=UPI001FAE909A|nr:MBL fold metallo-hydrolase [Parabacteroides sp. FAFU027]